MLAAKERERKRLARLEEERLERLREEAEALRLAEEARKKADRKKNCKKVDELLEVILSGKIFSDFNTKAQLDALVPIPNKFDNHVDYIEAWDPLFFYELQCHLT
jgi:hypothetical protein